MTTAISITPVTIDQCATPSNQTVKPLDKILQKVQTIASFVFSAALILFANWLNPSIFAVSFLVSAAFSKNIQQGINRIQDIWQQSQWKSKLGLLAVAYMRLPLALGLFSCLSGANLGISISNDAQAKKRQAKKTTAPLGQKS